MARIWPFCLMLLAVACTGSQGAGHTIRLDLEEIATETALRDASPGFASFQDIARN